MYREFSPTGNAAQADHFPINQSFDKTVNPMTDTRSPLHRVAGVSSGNGSNETT
jgi:hypothetical protein